MGSCTVETINALWTALAWLTGALLISGFTWKSTKDSDPSDRALGRAIGFFLAAMLMPSFHIYGQDALRYAAADFNGHVCERRSGGKVKITRPAVQKAAK